MAGDYKKTGGWGHKSYHFLLFFNLLVNKMNSPQQTAVSRKGYGKRGNDTLSQMYHHYNWKSKLSDILGKNEASKLSGGPDYNYRRQKILYLLGTKQLTQEKENISAAQFSTGWFKKGFLECTQGLWALWLDRHYWYTLSIVGWRAGQFLRSIFTSNITGKLCRTSLFRSSGSKRAMLCWPILVTFHNIVICSQGIHHR